MRVAINVAAYQINVLEKVKKLIFLIIRRNTCGRMYLKLLQVLTLMVKMLIEHTEKLILNFFLTNLKIFLFIPSALTKKNLNRIN